MKFSTRTLYGLRAILVLAGRYGEGSLSVSQIAKREKLSVAYLEQILNSLKKKGLVRSVRGPQGGYVLSKKPAEITLSALFGSLEGGQNFEEAGQKLTLSSEPDEVEIGNFIFWKKFWSSIEKGLSEVTLKELVDESRRLKKTKPGANFNFHI